MQCEGPVKLTAADDKSIVDELAKNLSADPRQKRRTTRSTLARLLAEKLCEDASQYMIDKFWEKHNLQSRNASNSCPLEIESRLKEFHGRCEKLHQLHRGTLSPVTSCRSTNALEASMV